MGGRPPERRLDLRTRAVLHARAHPGEAATHQSALAVHGLPLHGVATDVVDLVGQVKRGMRQTDPASESVGETRARLLLVDLGHDVRSQVRIPDTTGAVFARVDLLVGTWVVVEFDGLVKYEGAEGRAALAAEKAREDRLRAMGYEVVRLTWADLARPHRVQALVRSALERVAAREPRPSAS